MSTSSSDRDPSKGDDQDRSVVDDRELEALAYILQEDGVAQSELWKELDVSSRTGSRVARQLADAGLLTREQTTYESRQTYWLTVTDAGRRLVQERERGDADADADAPADTSHPVASAGDATDGDSERSASDRGETSGEPAATRPARHAPVTTVLDEPAAVRGAVIQYLIEHAPTDVSRIMAGVPADPETIRSVLEEFNETGVIDVTVEQRYGRTTETVRVAPGSE